MPKRPRDLDAQAQLARPKRVSAGARILIVVSALVGPALAAQTVRDARAAESPSSGRAGDEAVAAEARAVKAARDARLKADFERLSADLRTAVSGYQAQIAGLQHAGVPREQWPPHPNAAHYPRLEELALQDQPDALRWCLSTVGLIGVPLEQVVERKTELYARLVVVHPDQPWMVDVTRWLQGEASPGGLGFERVNLLLATLADATTVRATRAAALAARSAILALRLDPESRAEHARLVRELAEKHADTPAGASAKGTLFQAEHLAPGRTPPDLEAVDTDGRAFRLSDYRGKVLVLDFWGFWCGPCVRSLPGLKELVERHAAEPFALVGIATDPDLAEFRQRAAGAGIPWRNAWAGGTSGPWPVSWGVQRYPSVFVLDARGVVRFVDVRGDDLARAVRTLLDEQRPVGETPPR